MNCYSLRNLFGRPPILLVLLLLHFHPLTSSSPCVSVRHTHLDGSPLSELPLAGGMCRTLRTVLSLGRRPRGEETVISVRVPLDAGMYVDPDAPSPSDQVAGGHRCESSDGAACVVRYRTSGVQVDIERPAYESSGYDLLMDVSLSGGDGTEIFDAAVTINTSLHTRYHTPNADHRVIMDLLPPNIYLILSDGSEQRVGKCKCKKDECPSISGGKVEVRTGDNRHETFVAILTALSMVLGTVAVMTTLEKVCVWR